MSRPRLLLSLLACALLVLPAAASARIKNGQPVAEGDFEWTVALVLDGGPPAADYNFCGGTLIDASTVVTAAHCVAGLDPGTEPGRRKNGIEIVAGVSDLTGADADADFIDVEQIYVMPGADGIDPDDGVAVPRYDAAVLKLASPVPPSTTTATIPPVTPTVDDALWAPGDLLEVSGWGRDELDGYPTQMNHATIERWSDARCSDAYDENPRGPGGASLYDQDDMICGLDEDPPGTVVDACDGDSGGPLTTHHADPDDPNGRKLVGIVSWGSPECDAAGEGGVYTRVGNPEINQFITDVRDAANDPKPQPHHVSGLPTISGTQRVGETVTCARSGDETYSLQTDDGEVEPTQLDLRLRAYYPGFGWATIDRSGWQSSATPPGPIEYGLSSAEDGVVLACDLYANVAGHPGYAVANFYDQDSVVAPALPAAVIAPPPVVPPPVPPALPQPPVVAPRDEGLPRTSRVSRRCNRRTRRCILNVFTTDTTTAGALASGVTAVEMRLTTRYRCLRRGKRRTCISRRTLAARPAPPPGRFTVRTPKLRAGLHTLRIIAIDRNGNREPRALTYTFRLRASRLRAAR